MPNNKTEHFMFRDQTFRLTNWAFKLRPLHESPLHHSQNKRVVWDRGIDQFIHEFNRPELMSSEYPELV